MQRKIHLNKLFQNFSAEFRWPFKSDFIFLVVLNSCMAKCVGRSPGLIAPTIFSVQSQSCSVLGAYTLPTHLMHAEMQ